MIKKFLKILPWVFGVLVVVNLLLLDWFFFRPQATPNQQISIRPTLTPAVMGEESSIDQCPSACTQEIQQTVREEIASLPLSTPAPVRTSTPKTTPAATIKTTYVAINSSGSTTSTSWTDISGTDFYFDLSDYPTAKNVRWEASLQSYLSSDPAYLRLYDVTNKRAIDGSDLSTHSPSYEYLRSSDLSIWRGNNLYRIQAKGSSGNTVGFTAPRLKVTLE